MRQAFLIVLFFLAACKSEEPAAPTEQQSAQLNDADEMLNAMAQNEEGPEANTSSPSNSSN